MFQQPSVLLSILVALTGIAACGDDPAPTDPEGACAITGPVRLLVPPKGWDFDTGSRFGFSVLDDFILFTFDLDDAPDRRYSRFDRCTGEITPMPSLTPGLVARYTINTPDGRVLYAKKNSTYYIVDRLDVPGDDPPRKIAGLPGAGFLDLDFYARDGRPYAFFWRGDGIYTHNGDPDAPALRVSHGPAKAIPYDDAVLIAEDTGDLRLVDPFTGDGEVLRTDAQINGFIEVGATPAEARVLWQSKGGSAHYVTRLDGGDDVALEIDPALTTIEPYWWSTGGEVVAFADPEGQTLLAAARTDTGASIEIPEHIGVEYVLYDGPLGLILPDPDEHVQALWEPLTGELHVWYRGPEPAPSIYAFNGDSIDYYQREDLDPPVGSLWRLDLTTGDRRQIAPRVNHNMVQLDDRTLFIPFHTGPTEGPIIGPRDPQTYDLKLFDIETGLYTNLANDASSYRRLDDSLLYFDPRGYEPGLWARPLP